MSGFVPWVTAWSAETDRTVQPCKFVGGKLAVFVPDAQGVGRPLFKQIHLPRPRRAFAKRLCEVCGEYAAPSDRWLWPMGVWVSDQGEEISRADARSFCAAQGFNHARCGQIAKELCPFLRSITMRPQLAPPEAKIKGVIRRVSSADYSQSVILSLLPGMSRVQYRRTFGSVVPIREAAAALSEIEVTATGVESRLMRNVETHS